MITLAETLQRKLRDTLNLSGAALLSPPPEGTELVSTHADTSTVCIPDLQESSWEQTKPILERLSGEAVLNTQIMLSSAKDNGVTPTHLSVDWEVGEVQFSGEPLIGYIQVSMVGHRAINA
jgi:hypothetical protein